jgi:catechol 2,3-dioxygenase-like lactoylglutathione lyase family enzyme
MRLSNAMLYVKDIERMASFYRDTLGLQPIAETRLENWVEFETGGARFSLHAVPNEIAQGIDLGNPPQPRENVPVKLTFAVADADREMERLTRLGVPLIRRPWGACDVVDPEGNILQIV